jgi:F0F1-type ATP synthase epsilon subunit
MATLEPCELKLYESGSESPDAGNAQRFAQGEGYLQVIDNSALLVVEEAIEPDALDRAELEEKLKAAQERLDSTADPAEKLKEKAMPLQSPEYRRATEERRRAELNVKRYEVFLEIAGGS